MEKVCLMWVTCSGPGTHASCGCVFSNGHTEVKSKERKCFCLFYFFSPLKLKSFHITWDRCTFIWLRRQNECDYNVWWIHLGDKNDQVLHFVNTLIFSIDYINEGPPGLCFPSQRLYISGSRVTFELPVYKWKKKESTLTTWNAMTSASSF